MVGGVVMDAARVVIAAGWAVTAAGKPEKQLLK
jgi:hypothetical protein